MSHVISKAIKDCCCSFAKNIKDLDLRADGHNNGYPEKNLVFHFLNALSKKKSFRFFLEVPFKNSESGKFDLHFDFFATDGEVGIFGEAKRLLQIGTFRGICYDADRLTDKKIINQILKNGGLRANELKIYSLIIAECWEPQDRNEGLTNSQWWEDGDERKNLWKGRKWKPWFEAYWKSKLREFEFGREKINCPEENWDLFCLYAFKEWN